MATAAPRRRSRRIPLRTNKIRARRIPATPDTKPRFGRDAAKAIDAVKEAVNDAVTKVVKSTGGSDPATVAESNVATTVRPESGQRAARLVNNVVAAVTHRTRPHGRGREDARDETRRDAGSSRGRRAVAVESRDDPREPRRTFLTSRKIARIRLVRNVRETLFAPKRSDVSLATPMLAQPQATAAAAPQIDVPPVISAIGTAVFGLISFAESVFEGPPTALPGSGVTVKRSTLTIGDQEVPADWYFPDTYDPESDTPPERIIYLQHGFGARGVFYDYTASYLAQQTNSVVVAPSVTSNLFATDGMWLGGDPMHRAMADLFRDDNPALLQSAKAAGYGQGQLPQQVVLVGHSLGRRGRAEHGALHGGRREEHRTVVELPVGRGGDARRCLVHRSRGAHRRDPERHPGLQPVLDAQSLEPVRHHGRSAGPGTAHRIPRRADALRLAFGCHGGRQPAGPTGRLRHHRLRRPCECRGHPGAGRELDQRLVRRSRPPDLHRHQLLLRRPRVVVHHPDEFRACRRTGRTQDRPDQQFLERSDPGVLPADLGS